MKDPEFNTLWCAFCMRTRRQVRLVMHHRLPVEDGGGDDPENFAVLCQRCHVVLHRYLRGWARDTADEGKAIALAINTPIHLLVKPKSAPWASHYKRDNQASSLPALAPLASAGSTAQVGSGNPGLRPHLSEATA